MRCLMIFIVTRHLVFGYVVALTWADAVLSYGARKFAMSTCPSCNAKKVRICGDALFDPTLVLLTGVKCPTDEAANYMV